MVYILPMSTIVKLLERFKARPKDLTYNELRRILKHFGYIESKSGKTSGSSVAFENEESKDIIRLHKPHPSPIVKLYAIDAIQEKLRERGLL